MITSPTSVIFIAASMIMIGAGMGLSSVAFIMAVQNAVPWKLRGVATASTQFFRTIGGTVGVAIMGTILNAQMAQRFAPIFAQFANAAARLPKDIVPANVLLTPGLRGSLPTAFLNQLQAALAQGLFWIYLLLLVLAVLGVATMFLLPGGRADQYTYKGSEEDDEALAEPASESVANFG